MNSEWPGVEANDFLSSLCLQYDKPIRRNNYYEL